MNVSSSHLISRPEDGPRIVESPLVAALHILFKLKHNLFSALYIESKLVMHNIYPIFMEHIFAHLLCHNNDMIIEFTLVLKQCNVNCISPSHAANTYT